MAFYFFKTMSDKGRNRLRPLAGQTLGSAKVDQALNVSAEKSIRTLYPLGTIFGSEVLTAKTGFYDAGDIFPVGIPDEQYNKPEHKPPMTMRNAYEKFIGVTGDASDVWVDDDPEIEEEVPKSKKISLLDKMKVNKDFKLPTIAKDGFHVEPDNWFLLLRNITNQVNTLMVGPTGSGKTELILLACEKLGVECNVYDMGSMYDPVSGLLGVHRLQEGGVSTFDYAKFTSDIAKPGVVLLDELSRAPVTTNNILFPCLDSRRKLPVEIAGTGDTREVFVHEDCCFIATANVGSEYTGTMSMDKALVNRFFPVELDYMPKIAEETVMVKRTGVALVDAKHVVAVATSIRNMYQKQEISSSISTRESLMACELINDGWSTLRAMELVFLPLFEGTKADGERGIVAKLLMSR